MKQILEAIKWSKDELVMAIAQDAKTQQVLMVAWMNPEALQLTLELGHAVYWSRSRQKLWHKGEESGHQQHIKKITLDCDGDALLLAVEQIGGIACHTGREHCFYRQYIDGKWVEVDAMIKDPSLIYKKDKS